VIVLLSVAYFAKKVRLTLLMGLRIEARSWLVVIA
jgi:hypothetical protein